MKKPTKVTTAAMRKRSSVCVLQDDLAGLLEELEPDVAQVGGERAGPLVFKAVELRRRARASGSTSACALSVSISTARLRLHDLLVGVRPARG